MDKNPTWNSRESCTNQSRESLGREREDGLGDLIPCVRGGADPRRGRSREGGLRRKKMWSLYRRGGRDKRSRLRYVSHRRYSFITISPFFFENASKPPGIARCVPPHPARDRRCVITIEKEGGKQRKVRDPRKIVSLPFPSTQAQQLPPSRPLATVLSAAVAPLRSGHLVAPPPSRLQALVASSRAAATTMTALLPSSLSTWRRREHGAPPTGSDVLSSPSTARPPPRRAKSAVPSTPASSSVAARGALQCWHPR